MKIRTNAPPTPPVFLPRRQYAGQTDYVPRYSEQETQEFLEDVSDLYDSIKLWNDKSGIFGLLTSELRPSLRQQHMGPGPHPGTGSPQDAHAGDDAKGERDLKTALLERSDVIANPFERDTFAFLNQRGDAVRANVTLRETTHKGKKAYLLDIIVPEESRKKGYGRAVMTQLMLEADRSQSVLLGIPGPFGRGDKMTEDQLYDWYESLGFVEEDGSVVYYPKKRTVLKIRGDAPFVGNVRTITQNARPRAEVFFDFASGRWRYLKSGRLVPISRVRLGVLRVAKAQELAIRRLSAQLVNGEISQAQWYNGMRKLIKDQYRASWIASIGGVENYNRSEVSKFGWAVRPQYRWLDNFLNELQTGKQPLNGRVALRAAMYARAGNGMYQNNLRKIAEQNGFTEARRILGENESHCNDSGSHEGCIEQAALGWQPIGQVLEIGSATCLSNCLCQMEFR